jgi:hypothetical protein
MKWFQKVIFWHLCARTEKALKFMIAWGHRNYKSGALVLSQPA